MVLLMVQKYQTTTRDGAKKKLENKWIDHQPQLVKADSIPLNLDELNMSVIYCST